MQILTAPRPYLTSAAAPAPPPGPPAPPPEPAAHFRETSRSARRDLLLGAAMVASSPGLLPRPAGPIVGGVVGVLGMAAAYGEVREGMRRMDTHEVLDGALHMGLSVALLTSAAMSNPLTGVLVTAGGLSLLALKTLYDHPKDVADVLLRQPLGLVRDAGKSLWVEFGPAPKTPEPAKTP